MRRRYVLAIRSFVVTVASWLLVAALFALPVFAEEEEEGTTTTTTTTLPTTTTTTTTTPTTTTTSTTTTTTPTTTTTASTTTTTTTTSHSTDGDDTAVVQSDDTKPADPTATPWPDLGEPSTSPAPSAETTPQAFADKDGLVVRLSDATQPGGDGTSDRGHIDPREELGMAFRAVAEALEAQILPAVILGLVVGALTLIGVDRSWGRNQPLFAGAPTRDS